MINPRPDVHEPWCAEHGYEECTCDLEQRQAAWDAAHRDVRAAELPRATMLSPQLIKSRCGICGREATVRIGGRNYCEDHRECGYTSALFAANAGDD